jgi:hypothetical protein
MAVEECISTDRGSRTQPVRLEVGRPPVTNDETEKLELLSKGGQGRERVGGTMAAGGVGEGPLKELHNLASF